jgi:hypothetical protein
VHTLSGGRFDAEVHLKSESVQWLRVELDLSAGQVLHSKVEVLHP